jgi:hypothetical protein
VSRSTKTDFPGAFRVVTVITNSKTGHLLGDPDYVGPYQTIGAAKGMLTRMLWEYNNYGSKVHVMSGHIEQTPEGWEKVEI